MGQTDSTPKIASQPTSSSPAETNKTPIQQQKQQQSKQQQQQQEEESSLQISDRSQLGIIKSQKINKEVLKWVGDSETTKMTQDEKRKRAIEAAKNEKICRGCCFMFGGVLSTTFSGMVAAAHTAFIAYRERHRIPIDAQRLLRQTSWMTIPAAVVGSSLHFFLADAMWSQRRNTFGTAWSKAILINTAMWLSMIGGTTLFWRYALRHCGNWGSKIYYRYPIPSTNLESRLLEDPTQVWRGMGWSYWALGVMTGQLGYISAVAAVSYSNKPYYLMSPTGPYSKACCPRWRREALAKSANMELPADDRY